MAGEWEPYFRPSTRVHNSGFRCFECGYLKIGPDNKAEKKVVVARGVDHISNWLFSPAGETTAFDMDLLRDGNIRIFNHQRPLFWDIPGFSDASITPEKGTQIFYEYDKLDAIWEEQNERK